VSSTFKGGDERPFDLELANTWIEMVGEKGFLVNVMKQLPLHIVMILCYFHCSTLYFQIVWSFLAMSALKHLHS
jgi:hypothetical protein